MVYVGLTILMLYVDHQQIQLRDGRVEINEIISVSGQKLLDVYRTGSHRAYEIVDVGLATTFASSKQKIINMGCITTDIDLEKLGNVINV